MGILYQVVGEGEQYIFQQFDGMTRSAACESIRRLIAKVVFNGLPIDPAIATIIVLYVVKIGLNTFCEYTEPHTDPKLPAAEDEKEK